MYVFVLRHGYREMRFEFDDFNDGCLFMIKALNHTKEQDVSFVVLGLVEEDEDETV